MFDGVVIGITGYLIANVLAQPGEVLAYWPGLVKWLNRSARVSPMDWNWFQHWTNKITWLCGKCIAGNIAVVYTVFSGLGQGFHCIALAIFTAYALEKWLN